MTDVSNQRVGFVGLGDQGSPMALAIVEAGFLLHAWARRPQSYDALGGAAFERHDDLASLARAVDVLALCLRDDQDIRDLIRATWLARCSSARCDGGEPRDGRPQGERAHRRGVLRSGRALSRRARERRTLSLPKTSSAYDHRLPE